MCMYELMINWFSAELQAVLHYTNKKMVNLKETRNKALENHPAFYITD